MKHLVLILMMSLTSAKSPGICLACLLNPQRRALTMERLQRKKRISRRHGTRDKVDESQ